MASALPPQHHSQPPVPPISFVPARYHHHLRPSAPPHHHSSLNHSEKAPSSHHPSSQKHHEPYSTLHPPPPKPSSSAPLPTEPRTYAQVAATLPKQRPIESKIRRSGPLPAFKSIAETVQVLKAGRRCLNCAARGHVSRNCRNVRICYRCHSLGHVCTRCPKRLNSSAASSNVRSHPFPMKTTRVGWVPRDRARTDSESFRLPNITSISRDYPSINHAKPILSRPTSSKNFTSTNNSSPSPPPKTRIFPMEHSSYYLTATIIRHFCNYETLLATLSQAFGHDEWPIFPLKSNVFLFACPTIAMRDHILHLKLFVTPTTAFYIQPWSEDEYEPQAVLEPFVCWARITGIPEFLRYNEGACREILEPMGSLIELDICDWSDFDHRDLFARIQFFKGIGEDNTYVSRFNNRNHLIRVQRTNHIHSPFRMETVMLGLPEQRPLPCFRHHTYESPTDDEEEEEDEVLPGTDQNNAPSCLALIPRPLPDPPVGNPPRLVTIVPLPPVQPVNPAPPSSLTQMPSSLTLFQEPEPIQVELSAALTVSPSSPMRSPPQTPEWLQMLSPMLVRRSTRLSQPSASPEASGSIYTPVIFSSKNKRLNKSISRMMGVHVHDEHYSAMQELELERIASSP